MKKIFVIFQFLILASGCFAQSYLRYIMKNGSFHGFYTEMLDSISYRYYNHEHNVIHHIGNESICFPLSQIEEVYNEEYYDLDNYRVVSIDIDTCAWKSMLVDNRGWFIASKNGSYCNDDTVVVCNETLNIKMQIITNHIGQILLVNDDYYCQYYSHQGMTTDIVDIYDDGTYFVHPQSTLKSISCHHNNRKVSKAYINKSQAITTLFQGLTRSDVSHDVRNLFIEQFVRMTDVADNPTLRPIFITYDVISSALDLTQVLGAAWATVSSAGAGSGTLLYSLGLLANDVNSMLSDIMVSTDRMNAFRQYLEDNQRVVITPNAPTDITTTSVTLNARIFSEIPIQDVEFYVTDGYNDKIQNATLSAQEGNVYQYENNISNLKEGVGYGWSVRCLVSTGGLRFHLSKDGKDFRLLGVSVMTGNTVNITANSAECNGTISKEGDLTGCESGIMYWENEGNVTKCISNSLSKDFMVHLSNLKDNTKYYYYAYAIVNEKMYKGETRTFTTSNMICPDHNHPHLIDLGLPSNTKWACCNVNANNPWESGGFYAFGETYEKSNYDNNHYLFYNDVLGYSSIGVLGNISGTKSLDAATSQMGNDWCMPDLAQCRELSSNCNWEWTFYHEVPGYKVSGNNGNVIFLPATGFKVGSSQKDNNTRGCYRSSVQTTAGRVNGFNNNNSSYQIDFNSRTHEVNNVGYCEHGSVIRAVGR